MRVIELKKTTHPFKVGDECPLTEPNIKEDVLLAEDGEAVGFFMRSMPKKAAELASIANRELLSDRVPKLVMHRGTREQAIAKGRPWIAQYSTILGAIPPKPHMKRPYPSMSSTHSAPSARNFVKAMMLLAAEAESIIQDIMPEQYERQSEIFKRVPDEWKFGRLFTSSISNFNISAPYHVDTANIHEAVNVIITKRNGAEGGNLNVPGYGATFDQCDGSILVYPAWRDMHGVTPIKQRREDGYRNSLVFYPLKAFLTKKNESERRCPTTPRPAGGWPT